jgi:hypothetical protein
MGRYFENAQIEWRHRLRRVRTPILRTAEANDLRVERGDHDAVQAIAIPSNSNPSDVPQVLLHPRVVASKVP